MSDAAHAWAVVQIAELLRMSGAVLARAVNSLDEDVSSAMPKQGGWVLSATDTDTLRTYLAKNREFAERLSMLVDDLPAYGVAGTYGNVRDGAAAALAEGILDPATVVLAARALDIDTGWNALAEGLASTDVRLAWAGLSVVELLGSFRYVKPRQVTSVLQKVGLPAEASWQALTEEVTRKLADALRGPHPTNR